MKFLLLISLLPMFVRAADLPGPVVPDGIGINIHFTRAHKEDLDLIAQAGFKIVRTDVTWAKTEKIKGRYDFSDYDELTSNLQKHGLRPLYILCYSNALYEPGGASPQHPDSVAAYVRWVGAAVQHFPKHAIIWEIWNEPNSRSFWKPKPDADQYIALALAATKAIRQADPEATILAPASSSFPWDFLAAFCKSGALAYLDAFSVHPYRGASAPETASADYAKLRALIALDRPPGKELPLVCSEWGYSTAMGKGIAPELQAEYLVRQQLWSLSEHLPLSIWYDWKNDGRTSTDYESNFGIVTTDLQPKPAYLAITAMIKELRSYHFVRRLDLGDAQAVALLFEDNSGNSKVAAWTSDKTRTANLAVGEKTIPLQLTGMPIYVPAPGLQ